MQKLIEVRRAENNLILTIHLLRSCGGGGGHTGGGRTATGAAVGGVAAEVCSVAMQRGNARIIISRARQSRDRMGIRVTVGRAYMRSYGRTSCELDFGDGFD